MFQVNLSYDASKLLRKYRGRHQRYRILSSLTLGKLHRYYNEKRKKYKELYGNLKDACTNGSESPQPKTDSNTCQRIPEDNRILFWLASSDTGEWTGNPEGGCVGLRGYVEFFEKLTPTQRLDTYRNLIEGLDEQSIRTVNRILARIQFCRDNVEDQGKWVDILTEQEQRAIRK